jgi:para-nitrobenzyl esterase
MHCVTGCSEPPNVEANGERLLGERLANGVAAFRGIPFAEPPVGDLRWQRPRPLTIGKNERDATRFAPACMQVPRILNWYRDLAETFGAPGDVFEDLDVSEDCLYLNVWTPNLHATASLPVMVYIHGGSNKSGWSYEPNYHGHALAARGVVVVSIAYRLGVFGFFSHPDLDAANFALWDQLAALEWVRDQIENFGGDPNRVTVFGESSGAQDALALLATKQARPLIHRVILQSTAGFGIDRESSPTIEDEQQRGIATAELFGIGGDHVPGQMRQIPAEELLRVYSEHEGDYYHAPAVDGELLVQPVWDAINEGAIAAVPMIVGTNADEWYASTPEDIGPADIESRLMDKDYLNSADALAVVSGDADVREAIDRLDTAEHMLCPSQYLAERHARLHGNAWLYFFSRVREGSAGAQVRAYHGAELPYVFGTHDPWMTTTSTDWQLSDVMMSYWTNLATNGEPNQSGLPDWPVFDRPDGNAMEFANTARPGPAQEAVLCRLFRSALSAE